MTVWYIQDYKTRDGENQRLLYAVTEAGYEVHTSPYKPFDNQIDLAK